MRDLQLLDKFFVGFDQQLNRMNRLHDELAKTTPTNYPPYNIKRIGPNNYLIELAVAGFKREEVDVTVEDGKLVVKGSVSPDLPETNDDYIYKGIGTRNFTRTFILEENVEVTGANLINGMLQVELERIVPDHKKPRKIEVKEDGIKTYKQQLLQEAA